MMKYKITYKQNDGSYNSFRADNIFVDTDNSDFAVIYAYKHDLCIGYASQVIEYTLTENDS